MLLQTADPDQAALVSYKSCLIRVYSVCLWKYDISDPTQVDLASNFFDDSMYQHESLFIYSIIVGGA